MKHFWPDEDLIEFFTLSVDDHQLLANKSAPAKLGYAVLLKILQYEGRFPKDEQIPIDGVVPNAWKTLVLEIDGKGGERINRIACELCVYCPCICCRTALSISIRFR